MWHKSHHAAWLTFLLSLPPYNFRCHLWYSPFSSWSRYGYLQISSGVDSFVLMFAGCTMLGMRRPPECVCHLRFLECLRYVSSVRCVRCLECVDLHECIDHLNVWAVCLECVHCLKTVIFYGAPDYKRDADHAIICQYPRKHRPHIRITLQSQACLVTVPQPPRA